MKKGILVSIGSLAAVLGMVAMASANSTDWQYFTNAADAGKGPGTDLLMGTGDDIADSNNAAGAYSAAYIIWDPANPSCPPPSVGYLTGYQTVCMGDPAGDFTMTYLEAVQTELPGTGTGTTTLKLTSGQTSGGDGCGAGPFSGIAYETAYYVVGPPVVLPPLAFYGKVFDADTAVATDFVCGPGAGFKTYTAAYLNSVRTKLPAAATYFQVVCASVNLGPSPIPCLNDATSAGTSILWTNDPITCDGQCCDDDGDDVNGSQCAGNDCDDANPAAYPGAPEIQCNDVDEDCDGSDSCGGGCAAGPAE